MSVMVKDRIAQMYEHAWHYIGIINKLSPEERLADVGKKLKSYATSCSTSVVAEGLLAALSFEASKAGEKAIKEVIKISKGEDTNKLEGVENENLAHALVYDCVASWILPLLGEREGFYRENPLKVLLLLAKRSSDLILKSRMLNEVYLLLEALKRLAEGEFG